MNDTGWRASARGFTLVELLIVVSIIGILAAVAIPNLQGALIRSKTARVSSDLDALAKALTMYGLDCNEFPAAPVYAGSRAYDFGARLRVLTSPISYLNDIPRDPFPHRSRFEFDTTVDLRKSIPGADTYGYFRSDFSGPNGVYDFGKDRWMVSSSGPDGYIQYLGYFPRSKKQAEMLCAICSIDVPVITFEAILYHPSNGLVSPGELIRWSD